jgi:hypothetical protein
VVQEVVRRSTIGEWEDIEQKQKQKAADKIKALGLSKTLTDQLMSMMTLINYSANKEDGFNTLLDTIPSENDEDDGEDAASFKDRAIRVAEVLRQAAALLPR